MYHEMLGNIIQKDGSDLTLSGAGNFAGDVKRILCEFYFSSGNHTVCWRFSDLLHSGLRIGCGVLLLHRTGLPFISIAETFFPLKPVF